MGWILSICGAIGLVAAGTLSIEKYKLLTNPFYAPSCNVSATINCGTVMQSDQAAAFGFPNPFIGLVGFAVVLTIGVAVLAGARFSRWFWWGLTAGVAAGLVFVGWLAFQSIFVIEALCPYCMAVWAVMLVLAGTMARCVIRAPRMW
nr:vitamin K epoxide reductase family protein [Flexivirga meconopsidis]